MLLANCMIAECPHCSKKKELMQLLSGNTYGAELWSDCKKVAPMMPHVSPVQKCLECGHFFLMEKVDVSEGDVETMEKGWLDFEDAVKALHEIYEDNQGDDDVLELLTVNMVWAYNDIIRNDGVPTDEQRVLFKDIVTEILKHKIFRHNAMLRAELYREMGNFNECIKMLKHSIPMDSFLAGIHRKIIKKAEEGDSKLFKIE